jgi:anti-anti-sigma factor
MKISKSEENGTLRLSGALEIYEAQSLRDALMEQLASGPELVLDLGSVESCDTSGAQLLWAAIKAGSLAGKRVRLERISPAVSECWAGLGLPLKSLTPVSA